MEVDLTPHFDTVADIIHSVHQNGGRTLVHCLAGVSRSTALVLAYLVKYRRMSLREAYHFLATQRPVVRPSVNFWHQLIGFEKRVRDVTRASVRFVDVPGSDQLLPDVYMVTVEEETEEELLESCRLDESVNLEEFTQNCGTQDEHDLSPEVGSSPMPSLPATPCDLELRQCSIGSSNEEAEDSGMESAFDDTRSVSADCTGSTSDLGGLQKPRGSDTPDNEETDSFPEKARFPLIDSLRGSRRRRTTNGSTTSAYSTDGSYSSSL